MAENGTKPILTLAVDPGLRPLHAGLFISPGRGRHPDRVGDSWEVIVVERGRLGLAVGGTDHDLGPGDWVLMPKGVRHHGTREYPRDLRFAWLHFVGGFVPEDPQPAASPDERASGAARFVPGDPQPAASPGERASGAARFVPGDPQPAASPGERASGAAPSLKGRRPGRVFDAGTRAVRDNGSATTASSFLLALPACGHLRDPALVAAAVRRAIAQASSLRPDPLVGGLLLALVLAELAASPANATSPTDAADELAERALRWIRERFREPISTATVARACGVTPDHLGRCFRRAHGGTVVEAINRCRLDEAQRLLLLGGGRIADVAQAAGFGDPQWLRRLLRRQHGIPPRAWRRLHARVHVNTA
jgi:AraC-like DNA-binding protein